MIAVEGWRGCSGRGYPRDVATLGDLMTKDLLQVAPEDTLGHAAELMVERGVSSAVVTDFGRLLGILTERDIVRAAAGRIHSSEARVREWMTAEPITVTPEVSPEEAGRVMLENGFRHLPVTEGDRAVGIVSIRDIAEWSVRPPPA